VCRRGDEQDRIDRSNRGDQRREKGENDEEIGRRRANPGPLSRDPDRKWRSRSSGPTWAALDDPTAGTGSGQGTEPHDINTKGALAVYYCHASDCLHGFE